MRASGVSFQRIGAILRKLLLKLFAEKLLAAAPLGHRARRQALFCRGVNEALCFGIVKPRRRAVGRCWFVLDHDRVGQPCDRSQCTQTERRARIRRGAISTVNVLGRSGYELGAKLP